MGMLEVFSEEFQLQFPETMEKTTETWWLELLSFWGLAYFQKTIRNVYLTYMVHTVFFLHILYATFLRV